MTSSQIHIFLPSPEHGSNGNGSLLLWCGSTVEKKKTISGIETNIPRSPCVSKTQTLIHIKENYRKKKQKLGAALRLPRTGWYEVVRL